MEPTRMKFNTNAKIVPARNVSTVSWKGRTQDNPFFCTKGRTASPKKDSTTHSSNRTRSNPPAINGAYSSKTLGPTITAIDCWAPR